jgi:hypothetical protein
VPGAWAVSLPERPTTLFLENDMAIKNWLKDSYKTHGNTTDMKSKANGKNMDDTPKGKVNRIGDKANNMDRTSKQGNSSGGGSVKQPTSSAGNGGTGGNVKMISGIVGSRKQ